jgi:MFS family permease
MQTASPNPVAPPPAAAGFAPPELPPADEAALSPLRPRAAAGPATPGGTAPDPGRRQFFVLFTAVMLPMFLAAVDQTLLATATPRIAAELGGLSDTSWIAVGYLLAATVMAPMYGRLGDRLGRRRVLLGALAVFALGSLACGLAQGMWALVGARVLQGLGGGGLMVLSQALIGEVVPPQYRPRYQGYFALVFTSSSVGGPVLGGLVVNHASWRWLFLANLPLCALAAWRVARLPRPQPAALHDAPMDPAGAAFFAVTAGSALLWFSFAGHRFALLSPASAALVALAVAGGVLLWRHQRRHAAPFLPLDIVRLPGAGWICAAVLAFAATLFALVFLVPIYLQAGQGASAAGAGLQLLPLTGGLVVGAVLNGRFVARAGVVGRLPPYGLAMAALALLVLALLPPSGWAFTAVAAACGIGLGMVMPNAQLSIQVLAGRTRLGAAAALVSLTRSCGAALGTAGFSGLVFVLLQAGHGAGGGLTLQGLSAAQVTQAFHVAFFALAGCVALGAWAAARAPVIRLEDGTSP